MRILVIGATGYIGNVISERLLKDGHRIVASVRSAEAEKKLQAQDVETFFASLDEDAPIIERLAGVDAVVYAAYGYNSIETAEKEVRTGKSHLTKIIGALWGSGKTFLLISGTGVVPDSTDKVYDESTPLPPTNSPVVMARRNLEKEIVSACDKGIRSIVLRPPCVYGRGGSFIVPRFLLDHALAKRESVYVEGTENHKRSAVHVDDLADLTVLAMGRAPSGSFYCTGAESGVTTQSIAEAISKCAGIGGQTKAVTLEESRQIFGHWGEWWSLNNQCAGDKARRELGWTPSRPSLLEDIVNGSYATSAKGALAVK
ncbi:MAG: NAD-dependent epimerase/dehydratase family protein [Candidatus Obscuribacterales bacterium]|jgi:nucleoside-diphosphate-sugar epimerase|nr:NAD-dependent epimerase/dehydratase family protein [Candidatus Obscuribacterales bacterium]